MTDIYDLKVLCTNEDFSNVLNKSSSMARKVKGLLPENQTLYVRGIQGVNEDLQEIEGNISTAGSHLFNLVTIALIAFPGSSVLATSSIQLSKKNERIQELETKLQFYEGTSIGGGAFPRLPVCEIPVKG